MARRIVNAIRSSGLSIYDPLIARPELFIDNKTLESILDSELKGFNLAYHNRTRSKIAKTRICEILGYPVPKSFKKTRPRFPGQNFDTAVQKANNFQPWNEEIDPSRRYVFVRVDANGIATKVRVVSGEVVADYDTTGKLTQKYQAKSRRPVKTSELVSRADTPIVAHRLLDPKTSEWPDCLPILDLFAGLQTIVGKTIANPGTGQERNRGGELHRLVAKSVSQRPYSDSGQFPDIEDQLLEVKLQTSTTIDLGLVSPDGTGQISDLPNFRHRDVRYAVFYGTIIGSRVRLDHVVLTTGADFFTFFQRFEGKVVNTKLQMHLPANFFD